MTTMTATTERKIGNRWHFQIDPKAADVGDLVEYRIPTGRYWSRVAKVPKTGLRLEAIKYKGTVVRPSKLVRLDEVVSVWRRGHAP